ncbi:MULTISPECIES: hypothetical protein [Bacillaceae]|uniref:hypothetical protein n=1 Tax=Bacillaceae TaxID=186817 RepID=UPI001602085E|nr:hypothetical protein [Bacillus sp. PK3_68]
MPRATLKEILDSLSSMSIRITSIRDRLQSVEKKIEELSLINLADRKHKKS